MNIALVQLSQEESQIKMNGTVSWVVPPVAAMLAGLVCQELSRTPVDAWLFWDGKNPPPDAQFLENTLSSTEVAHTGLGLGVSDQPSLIDFVAPTWMLNRDPAPDIEATSWRVSLRACLVQTEVIRQMGFIREDFHTLDAAALEWGHRCLTRGVIVRHVPRLLTAPAFGPSPAFPFEDELRFVACRFGRRWAFWAAARAVMSGYASLHTVWAAWQVVARAPLPAPTMPFRREWTSTPSRELFARQAPSAPPRVSVLIPTLDRYPYLQTLLHQLQAQTVPPEEIIVVDQTPESIRRAEIYQEFPGLPLVVLYQETPGQCSSRNRGLLQVKGDYILFLDDDDEIPPDLIEQHLTTLCQFGASVSSGVAEEVGAGPLPENFTFIRLSDVFPTNNTLICRDALTGSGLFDLAYEHGPRADGDLGMRVYLSGALMILNPAISVLHHHAPRGGLRAYKARTITYASSRQRLTHRALPAITEFYLAHRYFSPRQRREMVWIALLGTFRLRAGKARQLLKGLVALGVLPQSLGILWMRQRAARQLLNQFPVIPESPESPG